MTLFRRNRVAVFALIVLAVSLSACGLNTSGEPEIVSQQEVNFPTRTPTPPATATLTEPAATEIANEEATSTDAGSGDVEPPDSTVGRQLFVANCATCHSGEDGALGPSLFGIKDVAADRVAGMLAEEYVYESIVDPSAFMIAGYDDIMPKGYADQFSDFEIRSMVDFIMNANRPGTLSADGTQIEATAAPSALEPAGTLAVRGALTQGTEGADPIGEGLPVELYVVDPHATTNSIVGNYETVSLEDGTFVFEGVVRSAGYIYLIRMDYQGIPQGSQLPAIEGTESEITTDVVVYERTTERDSVGVTWAQILVNYAPIDEFGLEVRLDLELVNTGDRIVTSEEASETGWPVSVEVELPVGAFGIQPMQSEGSQRYLVEVTDGIPVLRDTWPLRPQQTHNITVLYYLPYEAGAVLDHAFGFPVLDGQILMPNDTVDFDSPQFDVEGAIRYRVASGGLRVTELQDGEDLSDDDPTLVTSHQLLAPLGEDDTMTFTLQGRPTRSVNVMAPTATASVSTSDEGVSTLSILLAGIGMLSLAVAGVLWWRQRDTHVLPETVDEWKPPSARASREDLMRAIAELDEAHDAGEIDETLYHERRDVLRNRLMEMEVGDDDA